MKYIHLMPINSPIYNYEYINLINSNFESSKHLFVLKFIENFRAVEHYDNCIYDNGINRLCVLIKYLDMADYVVLHSLCYTNRDIIRIDKKYMKKIIWCVWGHDLYEIKKEPTIPKLENFLNVLKSKGNITKDKVKADRAISEFKAVIISFGGDKKEIVKRFGNKLPIYIAPYTGGYYKEDIENIVTKVEKDRTINIMIGHNASEFLMHCKNLKKLKKYKNENIKIILPLGGDGKYARKVETKAIKLFGNEKVEIYNKWLPWEEYIKILCNIDIAIFSVKHQVALGNIYLLTYLNAKVYLPNEGIIAKFLNSKGIKTFSWDSIGKVSFHELIRQYDQNENAMNHIRKYYNPDFTIHQWKKLFTRLEKE